MLCVGTGSGPAGWTVFGSSFPVASPRWPTRLVLARGAAGPQGQVGFSSGHFLMETALPQFIASLGLVVSRTEQTELKPIV